MNYYDPNIHNYSTDYKQISYIGDKVLKIIILTFKEGSNKLKIRCFPWEEGGIKCSKSPKIYVREGGGGVLLFKTPIYLARLCLVWE